MKTDLASTYKGRHYCVFQGFEHQWSDGAENTLIFLFVINLVVLSSIFVDALLN
jgi:hypothetical protein